MSRKSSQKKTLERIVDLHAHVFNARCIPLGSIIANAIGEDCNVLAAAFARLLQAITESSYRPKQPNALGAGRLTDYYTTQICNVVEYELRIASGADDGAQGRRMTAQELARIERSALMDALREVANALGASRRAVEATRGFESFGALSDWARATTRSAITRLVEKMEPAAWGENENYVEFFYNMLLAEEHLAERLREEYGKKGLPPMRFVHHMMDMEKAYVCGEVPPYEFWPTQMQRMETLQRHSADVVMGFSAFDPRRDDWETLAKQTMAMTGFLGFKFYPAMGYKPIDDVNPRIRRNVEGFFRFCVAGDMPVFTHCTPQGFQTRYKQGLYTHPKLWARLLASDDDMAKLRLCFGHAGGEAMENRDPDTGATIFSAGWMAKDAAQWKDADNFARLVVELCGKYENVYCELAYITALLKPGKNGKEALCCLKQNLEFARNATESMKYRIADKLAYGSDWHMPSMVGNTRRYLDLFLQLRDEGLLDERFFWVNAYRYLRL